MNNSTNIQATLNFRLTTRSDFVVHDKLNIGLEYWVLCLDGKRLSGKHTITSLTDVNELNGFHKQNRVFVLVSCLDEDILIKN